MSEIKVGYPKSPLSAEQPERNGKFLQGGTRAGHRVPDGKLKENGQEIRFFSLLNSPLHQMLIFPSKHPSDLDDAWNGWYSAKLKKFLKAWWVRSEENEKQKETSKIPTLIDSDGKFRESCGTQEGGIYLIRPDGYVAFRTASLDPEVLTQYLQNYYQIIA